MHLTNKVRDFKKENLVKIINQDSMINKEDINVMTRDS